MKNEEFATALVMRRILLLCCMLWSVAAYHSSFFIFRSSFVNAQKRLYDTGFTVTYTPSCGMEEAVDEDFADTIAIEFTAANEIIIPVQISGRTFRFLFDTGASQGVAFTGSGMPYVRNAGYVVAVDFNGRPDTVRVVQLPPLQFGRLAIDGYIAQVVNGRGVRRPYDGMIGFDIVNKGLLCKIDTQNKRLILTDRKKHFAEEQGYEVKYKMQGFVPYVWVSPFKRHMDCALFDTGFQRLYSMNRESFQTHVYKSRQVAAQVEGRTVGSRFIGVNSVEASDTVYFLALDRLKWDDFAFRDYHTTTSDGPSHIGAALLRYGSLIINPRRERMVFQPYNGTDTVTISNQQPQMSFVPHKGRAMIGLIREESDAYQDGLRQGDIILKIDGRDVPTFTAFQQWRFVRGETHIFTVRRRNGSILDISVRK